MMDLGLQGHDGSRVRPERPQGNKIPAKKYRANALDCRRPTVGIGLKQPGNYQYLHCLSMG